MELLHNLYKIHSMSGQETAMRNFIKKYVRKMEGVSCVQKDGNLYIVKGDAETYPCIVAHTDQVQTKHSPDFKVFEYGDVLFAYSEQNRRQEGLGADDKNGIWVALKCLEHFDVLKVALFKEEEIGCGGSRVADMSFFSDVRFVLQADRRNGGDLITDISGKICSDEFLADISEISERRGYKPTSGMMTDVEELASNGVGVSCINFSCGYYNPHTDEEYTIVSELQNCLQFAMEIIENCTKVYHHKYESKWFGGYGGKYYFGGASHKFGGSQVDDKFFDDEDDLRSYNDSFGVKECEDDEVELVNFLDYPTVEDAVWAFIEKNYEYVANIYQLYVLWDYISSDAETFGFTYENYADMVDSYWEMAWEEEQYTKQ